MEPSDYFSQFYVGGELKGHSIDGRLRKMQFTHHELNTKL
jgi:hypothetical protein